MRKKHGLQNVKASTYRKDKQTREQNNLEIDKNVIKIFQETFMGTLENIKHNKFRTIKSSVHGHKIVEMANHIQTNIKIREKIQNLLEPVYTEIFSEVADCDTSTNETLFSSFYKKTNEPTLVDTLKDILVTELEETNFVRPFIGILHRQLLAELYTKSENTQEKQLTDTDQKLIYYICGNMLAALAKKNKKVFILGFWLYF